MPKKKTPKPNETAETPAEAGPTLAGETTPAEETPPAEETTPRGAEPAAAEAAVAESEAAEAPADESEAAEAPADESEAAEASADESAAEAAEAPLDPAVEIAGLKDQLLRALAETENVRSRAARDREEVAKYAITRFARDLLSVVDNLRRALDAVPEEVRAEAGVARLVEGVEMTEREFLAVLERHHIRRIEPLGEKFDHNFHQAMFEVPDSDKPAGTVVEVMQAGYAIAGRLLRPAMVAVAKRERAEAPQRVDTKA